LIVEFVMRPIGEIHTPFVDKRDTPIQPSRSTARGQVEVYPAYVDGLRDLDGFSHIILLYVFHRSDDYTLSVTPFLDDQARGLFATRYPSRPNPIGLSIVRLLSIHDHVLEIEGGADGTPCWTSSPTPDFDVRTDARNWWYAARSRHAKRRYSERVDFEVGERVFFGSVVKRGITYPKRAVLFRKPDLRTTTFSGGFP
jgi:tRNA-Thr(GGU) m(6)t(6)A37 methyltransferase TsaA